MELPHAHPTHIVLHIMQPTWSCHMPIQHVHTDNTCPTHTGNTYTRLVGDDPPSNASW